MNGTLLRTYHAGRRSHLCKQFQKWTQVDALSFEKVDWSNFFQVQLEDGRLLRRHQDHPVPRSSVPQEPISDQEIPPPLAAKQPELQLEDSRTQPSEPVQSAFQDIPEKRYPIRNRHAPR